MFVDTTTTTRADCIWVGTREATAQWIRLNLSERKWDVFATGADGHSGVRCPHNAILTPDGRILLIVDHRIMIASLSDGLSKLGAKTPTQFNPSDFRIELLVGGSAGLADGIGAAARFNRPDSMLAFGPLVFVTDSLNHCIRWVDLTTRRVTTVAGRGSIDPQFTRSCTPSEARLEFPTKLSTYAIQSDGRSQLGVFCESGYFVVTSPYSMDQFTDLFDPFDPTVCYVLDGGSNSVRKIEWPDPPAGVSYAPFDPVTAAAPTLDRTN